MTIATATAKSGPYNGNGVTTVFAYGFKINSATHIRVVRTSAALVETDLVLTTDYTVSGVGVAAGGSVTLTSGALAATGEKITLLRSPPFIQETDLENQGAYYAEVVESAFDLLTMQNIALKERVDRAAVIPVSDNVTDIDGPEHGRHRNRNRDHTSSEHRSGGGRAAQF